MSDTFHHTFDDVQLTTESGCEVWCELEVEFEASMTDNGIGFYEFWGTTHRDVREEYEINDWDVVKIQFYEDDEEQTEREWKYRDVGPQTRVWSQIIKAAESFVDGEQDFLDDIANNR